MPAVRASRILAGVLGVAIGLLPVAPPEHVHEAEEQGHVHVVVHRHLKTHGILEHQAEHHSTVDDDDGPVLTLTAVYTVPVPAPPVTSPPPVPSAVIEPPKVQAVARPFADVELLIHGPPRAPTPPRAPPSSLSA
jgi:hypothetical protein